MHSPQALGVLLWCISWVDLFYSFHGLIRGSSPAPVFFVTPLVVGITMVSVGPRMLGGGRRERRTPEGCAVCYDHGL